MQTFTVLLHASVYQELRRAGAQLREQVRKTLTRLRDGHWGGGTRVKRLSGVARPVYEARIDAGNRLLFSAIRSANREEPGRLGLHLQVWDLVSHDEVTRAARRNRAPEAEFLEMAVIEEFDLHEPPPHPEAVFEEVPQQDESGPLLHLLLPPDGFRPRSEEGIEGGVRWYVLEPAALADQADFQRLMDEGGAELELKLTRAQYDMLRARGPVLLAGSAGSGKTTIAVHRLAEAATRSGRSLYLSYSRWLVEHAQGLFDDLLRARRTKVATSPVFATFGDLYRTLAPASYKAHHSRPVTPALFEEWCRRSSRQLDPALVYEEIRSILKGACLNLGQPMLDEGAYLELGRKRAPLFVDERPAIFRLAQRYQTWLDSEERSDQVDLCRQAFRELKHGRAHRFDVVACDEAQDLTELEVSFVLALSSDPALAGVLLAGDTQQIVNPSGFRWAESRQAVMRVLGRREAPPSLSRLRQNYRSVRPLVELANSVLLIKREVYGRSDEDEVEEAVLAGPAPIEVHDSEDVVLAAIADFGPRCAVIVMEEAEAERLRARLDTTRVFDVREAKGLEFDTAILWKPLAADAALVERFLRGDPRLEKEARFRRLLQFLYVAVTRARRHLAVFEGEKPHPFWNDARFRGKLETEPASTLKRLFRQTASPAAWVKEGEYYLKRLRFRQAAECFRRGGESSREHEALALFAESLERWEEGLGHWRTLARLDRQAPLLERLGQLSQAIEAYRAVGDEEAAQRCQILVLERQGEWSQAAREWESRGRKDEARRCWDRAGNRQRSLSLAASLAEEARDWARAAQAWLEAEAFENAARCFRKARNAKGAYLAVARQHEAAKEWKQAAKAYGRAGEKRKAEENRARDHEAASRWRAAAVIYDRLGYKDRAAEMFGKAGAAKPIAPAKPQIPKTLTLESVLAIEAAGRYAEALDLVRSRIKTVRATALKRMEKGDYRPQVWQGIRAWEHVETRCSARLAEASGDWTRASRLWRMAGEVPKALQAREKAIEGTRDPVRRGRAWLKARDFKRAIAAFREAGRRDLTSAAEARYAEVKGHWQSAARLYEELGDARSENRCLAQAARLREDWEAAARHHLAAGQRTLADDAMRRSERKRQSSLFDVPGFSTAVRRRK